MTDYPDVVPSGPVTLTSQKDWPQCAQCNRHQQALGVFWPDLCHVCINANLRNQKHKSDEED